MGSGVRPKLLIVSMSAVIPAAPEGSNPENNKTESAFGLSMYYCFSF
jgi:hypothetical protein